jgi:hypothetical protein
MSPMFEMFEGHLHTWRCPAERSKEALCTRSDISYCGKEKFQVPSFLLCKTTSGIWNIALLKRNTKWEFFLRIFLNEILPMYYHSVTKRLMGNGRGSHKFQDRDDIMLMLISIHVIPLVPYEKLHNNICPLML